MKRPLRERLSYKNVFIPSKKLFLVIKWKLIRNQQKWSELVNKIKTYVVIFELIFDRNESTQKTEEKTETIQNQNWVSRKTSFKGCNWK